MVKTSASKTRTGPRTDPEAVERRRMQNRLAQRKRRQKRAQMAREEKERQQRLQAAQAVSQLTFINDSYSLPVPAYTRQPKRLPHVMTKNYFDYKPPQVEDVFASSPYFPRRTPVPSFEPDLSLPINGYPSPSSSNAPSTPPLSLYASSLIDEDLSSGITGNGNGNSNSNGISGGIDIDPNLYLNSPIGLTSPVSGKGQQQQHSSWDSFGMVPLAPNPPVPIMQMDRNRSASLPTQFTPPRSVPSLSSTPAPSGTRNRAPTTSSIVHPSTTNFGNSSSSSNCHDLWDIKMSGVDLCNPSIDNTCHAFMSPINMHTELSTFAANKTELHACAEQGNSHGVQLLLSCGAHIDAIDEFGRTPLHYAVLNNHLDLTRILVQQGATTTIADINGLNPMQIAAESDSREMRQMMHMMIMMTPPLLVPGA